MNYIDLSHQIFHGMPTYPSDPDVCFKQVKNIDYLKIKNVNLVSHVPFICFLIAINCI